MLLRSAIAIITWMALSAVASAQPNNQLTDTEKQQGWKLLFDGKTAAGWHTYNQKTFGPGWNVEEGTLHRDTSQKSSNVGEKDICTDIEYENFDLKLQWKISKNGNSGIIFPVHEAPQYDAPYLTGLEMQILDNDGHPDGKIHKHRAGDLYDLIASSSEPVHPVGEWNDAEVKLDHGMLALYLNGVQVVSTQLWTPAWDELVQKSKFSKWPGFAKYKSGHIDLQDHGFEVWFRNIRIKTL